MTTLEKIKSPMREIKNFISPQIIITISASVASYLLLVDFSIFYITAIFLLCISYAKSNNKLLISITIPIGFLFLIYSHNLSLFFQSFTFEYDSLIEIWNFDKSEAFFWLSTTNQYSSYLPIVHKKYTLLSIFIVILYIKTFIFFGKKNKTQDSFILLISISIFIISANIKLINSIIDSYYFNAKISKNFDALKNIETNHTPKDISTVVFIGESTSIFNMSLYGYFRETTPKLESIRETDRNFIVFRNAISTHTHTSPSLMEALSISTRTDDYKLPIFDRERISVVDVLKKHKLESILYSNQGQRGSWNTASNIIFKNSKNNFSTKSKLVGNNDFLLDRKYEHIFIEDFIKQFKENSSINSFFYHSYVGHGPYDKLLPKEYNKPVDDIYKEIKDLRSVVGDGIPFTENIDKYDSAIKYIDFLLYKTISEIKNTKRPIAFIYFSDHGESVYTNYGHDSSRFVHEMFRVPLFIYFNDAAKNTHFDIFKKYEDLSKTGEVIPTSELANIILDIQGIAKNKTKQIPQTYLNRGPDEFYVLDEYSRKYISEKAKPNNTNSFLIESLKHKEKIICYHRSNTLAKIRRGSLATNCLEIDVTFEKDNPFIYHPPKENNYLELGFVLGNVIEDNKFLWLDVKNLENNNQCYNLLEIITRNSKDLSRIMIEVQPYFYKESHKMQRCLSSLKEKGITISQYIPYYKSKDCNNKDFCSKVEAEINEILESGFTNISFDYSYMDLLNNFDVIDKFELNTWHVNIEDIEKYKNFKRLIPYTSDPNNY